MGVTSLKHPEKRVCCTVGDIMMHVGGYLDYHGECSVPWGDHDKYRRYLEYHGGYHEYHGGYHDARGGYPEKGGGVQYHGGYLLL